MSGYVSSEITPWATMDRGELVDRLRTVTQMHVPVEGRFAEPAGTPAHGYRCRLCKEPFPCSTRTVATGARR